MITKVKLHNFQGAKDRTLKFDGVTTIIGENRQGKSTVFRALEWICLNRPPTSRSGKINLHNWDSTKQDTWVKLWLDDGTVVTRRKHKGGNLYILNGEKHKAVGKGKVPEPIRKALRITEENFQKQFSSLFWFAEKPRQISQRLNAIINQSVIDKLAVTLAQKAREAKIAVGICRDRIIEARKDKKELAWVEKANALLSKAEKSDRLFREYKERFDNIKKLVEMAAIKEKAIAERTAALAETETPLAELEQLQSRFEKESAKWEEVNEILIKANDLRKRIDSNTSISIEAEKRLKRYIGTACPICKRPIVNLGQLK